MIGVNSIGVNSGAQRASTRRGVARAITAAMLAAFLVVPAIAITAAPALAVTPAPAYWLPEEQYDLQLVNCTRTGGWVLGDGSCRGYGSGRYSAYVRPLILSAGISNLVSRPYARLLAVRNQCSHFLDGDPGYRLRRAGYRAWTWGENIGCPSLRTTTKAAILASHLFFQAERSTNGGHWRNLKNPQFTQIGIGVWKYGSRVRLVNDFYRPA